MLTACRNDVMVVPMEDIDTGGKTVKSEIVGMYLLNEGNMGSNKSTLDYLDLSGSDSTVHYLRNIYSERNPSAVMSLGDVGNDCQIYGSRLWLVINCSNKVEVARAEELYGRRSVERNDPRLYFAKRPICGRAGRSRGRASDL